MLYNKPKNITYTSMCMWIDANAYADDCDDEKLYEYIYHIVKMLAYKQRFFEKSAYYEDFGIYASSKIFMRYKHRKQFVNDEQGNPKMGRIKSVLNYTKRLLYPYKVQFEQEFYAQNLHSEPTEDFTYDLDFHSVMMESVDSIRIENFKATITSLESCTRDFIDKVIVRDAVEKENIYISCMLSLLNSIVLSSKSKAYIKKLFDCGKLKVEHIHKIYKNNMKNSVVLYHLDESYRDRIYVLVNELRHVVSSNLSYYASTKMPTESVVKSMMLNTLTNDGKNVFFGDDDY